MQLNRPRSALLGYAESHASFSSQFKTMRFSYHISGGLPSPQPALRRRDLPKNKKTGRQSHCWLQAENTASYS